MRPPAARRGRSHQEWLDGPDERAEQREYWTGVIERVSKALAER
jgi:hypothetical protein